MSTTQLITKKWLTSTAQRVTAPSKLEQRRLKNFAKSAGHSIEFKQFIDPYLRDSPVLARRQKWEDKEYREAYMEASIEQGIAWQIRINRKLRGWSQKDLAKAMGTGQSAVSRLEDPSYGKHSLETLINVANAFDCALSVKLISYSELAFDSERLGEAEQCAIPFSIEWKQINDRKENSGSKKSAFSCRTYYLRGSTSDDPIGSLYD